MGSSATVVLETRGLHWATEKAVLESVVGRQPGVIRVEANPVAQTATVTFDPLQTSVAQLRQWVEECGYHCAGQSVPSHVCDPMEEPAAAEVRQAAMRLAQEPPAHEAMRAPAEVMGHGGHAGMSMAAMVRDMRNRFLVAAIFSVPLVLWSSIGRQLLHFTVPAPFGLRDDIPQPARHRLFGLDLLRWRRSGAACPNPRHDGPGRGRYRGRVDLLAGGDPDRWR